MLDDVVAEAVREDFAGQRRDRDSRALALEDVPEVLKVRVASPHRAVLQLEGRDVCSTDDLVVGVHLAADAVRLGVSDLLRVSLESLTVALRWEEQIRQRNNIGTMITVQDKTRIDIK